MKNNKEIEVSPAKIAHADSIKSGKSFRYIKNKTWPNRAPLKYSSARFFQKNDRPFETILFLP